MHWRAGPGPSACAQRACPRCAPNMCLECASRLPRVEKPISGTVYTGLGPDTDACRFALLFKGARIWCAASTLADDSRRGHTHTHTLTSSERLCSCAVVAFGRRQSACRSGLPAPLSDTTALCELLVSPGAVADGPRMRRTASPARDIHCASPHRRGGSGRGALHAERRREEAAARWRQSGCVRGRQRGGCGSAKRGCDVCPGPRPLKHDDDDRIAPERRPTPPTSKVRHVRSRIAGRVDWGLWRFENCGKWSNNPR